MSFGHSPSETVLFSNWKSFCSAELGSLCRLKDTRTLNSSLELLNQQLNLVLKSYCLHHLFVVAHLFERMDVSAFDTPHCPFIFVSLVTLWFRKGWEGGIGWVNIRGLYVLLYTMHQDVENITGAYLFQIRHYGNSSDLTSHKNSSLYLDFKKELFILLKLPSVDSVYIRKELCIFMYEYIEWQIFF